MGAAFRWCRQRYERGQVTRLGITELPYPFAHDIGIDAVAQGNTGYRCARLQAFLNNLSFEGFWIRVSLAHGDPLTRAKNGVHLNRWTPSPLTLGSGRCVGRTLTTQHTARYFAALRNGFVRYIGVPWVGVQGPSMALYAFRSIHAAQPTTPRFRSSF